MFVLVAYDVANPRRLKRTAKVLERFGVRVQRSVFECDLEERRLGELIATLKATIRRREDKVQIYRLCDVCRGRAASETTCGHRAGGVTGVWVV